MTNAGEVSLLTRNPGVRGCAARGGWASFACVLTEILHHDVRIEPLPIWTRCGQRLDLQARSLGWRVLSLRAVVDDAQATWTGCDDVA
jgi:hypothetical protein